MVGSRKGRIRASSLHPQWQTTSWICPSLATHPLYFQTKRQRCRRAESAWIALRGGELGHGLGALGHG
eukprot:scaffold843_cov330-Pavlova_lutheri.AAC.1